MYNFENIRIEAIQVCELEEVANLLTDAFDTNPAYSLIFNKTSKLREGLFWLFNTNLFLINRKKKLTQVVKEKDTGRIIGTFTVIPPEGIKRDFTDYFRIGLSGFILKFGFRRLVKMLQMDSYNKDILNTSIRLKEYYYLSMVVVKEEYRGTGIGSFMIKNGLDQIQREQTNCRIIGLTTQLPENITFYSRLGFQILDEGIVRFKQDEYYNCNMKYEM